VGVDAGGAGRAELCVKRTGSRSAMQLSTRLQAAFAHVLAQGADLNAVSLE
jgi:hypothetical protein